MSLRRFPFGASPKRARCSRFRLTLTTALALTILPSLALAQSSRVPSGGKVVAGAASISSPSASQVVIDQSTGKAIIDWSAFSISEGSSVQFNNGTGATLNRVTGGSLSSIDGLLSATGSVYLINPNGVIIGRTGVVRTGGNFVASTLDLDNADFLDGGALTFDGLSGGAVINLGKVGALGGNIALIAATVDNEGTLSATNGAVGLAAGHSVVMRDTASDNGMFVVAVGGADSSVSNSGDISAAVAELRANGGNIYALAGNTTGIITATGVSETDGHIWLTAGGAGTLQVDETLKATKANGDGGTVETSGGTVDFNGVKVDTSGRTGKTGTWLVDPYDLTVDAAAANTISTNLATTNVILQTTASGTSGPGTANASGVGDINIDSAISWYSGNSLTLDAYHGINILAPITVAGAGGVVIKTNDGGAGGDYSFGLGASGFQGSLSYTGTVNSGQALTINGTAYTLLYSMGDVASVTSGDYALARPLDASGTVYNGSVVTLSFGGIDSGLGFTIGGHFTGLGNTIKNLSLSGPADVGLFVYSYGTIRDLGITNETVVNPGGASPNVGSLVARNNGIIKNVYVSSAVNVDLTSSGFAYVGGLVGYNMSNGVISNSYASGSIATSSGLNLSAVAVGGAVGANDGSLSNIVASDVITVGNSQADAGGLVGMNNTGATIDKSSSTGTIDTAGANVISGGLVGYFIGGGITQSYAATSITGSGDVGGLIGLINGGAVSDSYALGAVSTTSPYGIAGGFIGVGIGGSVGNVYATGAVSSSGAHGSMAGLIGDDGGTTISNGYYDYQMTGMLMGAQADGSIGLTTAQFGQASSFTGFGFTTTPGGAGWVIVDADGSLNNSGGSAGATRPMLASEYSTTITNAHQLQLMAMNLGGSYALSNTVNASKTGGVSDVWITSEGFSPIGAGTAHFVGSLNGNGHAIAGLTIVGSGNYAGLFGYNSGTLSNILLSNVSIGGNASETGALVGWNSGVLSNDSVSGTVSASSAALGGLVGWSQGGTIIGASSSASVSNATLASHTGDLIGVNYTGSLTNSFATGSVFTNGYTEGGLAGFNGGTLTNDYATGNLTGSSGQDGGLVGYNSGTLTNDYATGSLSGSVSDMGGLVGWNESGWVGGAYSTGSVNDTATVAHVGGLVGGNNFGILADVYETGSVVAHGYTAGGMVGYNTGSLVRGYATGAVTGTATFTGGLIGNNQGVSLYGYTDTQTTGRSNLVGAGTASGTTGLTTATLKSGLPTGFGPGIWEWTAGRYPELIALIQQ